MDRFGLSLFYTYSTYNVFFVLQFNSLHTCRKQKKRYIYDENIEKTLARFSLSDETTKFTRLKVWRPQSNGSAPQRCGLLFCIPRLCKVLGRTCHSSGIHCDGTTPSSFSIHPFFTPAPGGTDRTHKTRVLS